MISKEEAVKFAKTRVYDVFYITDAGLDNKLYIYGNPKWVCGEEEYLSDIREITFEWWDDKDQKRRILKITENNIDFDDAPAIIQDAYRKHYFRDID